MADSRNRRRGTGFTNIGRYLQANEGSGLGTAVGQGIRGKAEEAEEQVKQVASGFETEAEKARIGEKGGEEEQKVSGIMGKFGQPGFKKEDVSEQDVQDVSGFLSAGYKGPLDIAKEDKERLQAQEGALSRLAGSTRTAQGREALLRRFAGGKGYTTGQQRLDNLLLGKTGTQELEQARRAATGISGQLRDVAEGAKLKGQTYKKEAQDFATKTKEGFEGLGTGIQEDVRSAAEARLDALNAIAQSSRQYDDAAVGQAERDALASLGLGDYKYLYGAADPAVQARDAVTNEYQLGEADLAPVRSLEQGLQLDALNRLLGKTDGYQTTTVDDAGDWQLDELRHALKTGKERYEGDVAALDTTPAANALDYYKQADPRSWDSGQWTLGYAGGGSDSSPAHQARQAIYKFLHEKLGYQPLLQRGDMRVMGRDVNSMTMQQVEALKNQYDAREAARIGSTYNVY